MAHKKTRQKKEHLPTLNKHVPHYVSWVILAVLFFLTVAMVSRAVDYNLYASF